VVFNPSATLNTLGKSAGLSYFNGSMGAAYDGGLINGTALHKDWAFAFDGAHAQLTCQLNYFKTEVERQLLTSGATISGRGTWSGDFSGFSFEYSSGGRKGFVKVTGVSLETGRQGLMILVYEH